MMTFCPDAPDVKMHCMKWWESFPVISNLLQQKTLSYHVRNNIWKAENAFQENAELKDKTRTAIDLLS